MKSLSNSEQTLAKKSSACLQRSRPGFAGPFVLTLRVLLIYMFSSPNTSPFVYFQF